MPERFDGAIRVRLPQADIDDLEQQALATGLTLSDIVRQLVRGNRVVVSGEYVAAQKTPERQKVAYA